MLTGATIRPEKPSSVSIVATVANQFSHDDHVRHFVYQSLVESLPDAHGASEVHPRSGVS